MKKEEEKAYELRKQTVGSIREAVAKKKEEKQMRNQEFLNPST